MYECSPRAILWQAGGDSATICLPSGLSRVRAPSPAPYVYIVSLLADEKPPGDNQAVLGKARRRCFCVHKDVQRHPASYCALLHQKSYPAVCCPEAISLENHTELASFFWKSSIGEDPHVE